MRTGWLRASSVVTLAAVVFLLLFSSTALAAHRTSGPAGRVGAALPSERLHFGALSALEPSWMGGSGVPWKYRYTYLEGGVNTGRGWEHLLDWVPAPPGRYALDYMTKSSARGYIPFLTYYEICQSRGAYPSVCDGNPAHEPETDFQHINDPVLMSLYYANFKLLLQQAVAFGQPVVIDVEPDFMGFMELRAKAAGSGSAASVSASVSGSGLPELAGVPDTVQGFTWALLRLRDLIAPNALLAIHASTFGNGGGVDTIRDPNFDPSADADGIATFLNSAGITSNPFGSTWDSVVIEVDGHDAAWYEQSGLNTAQESHWWDTANVRFPNFNRYLAWASRLHERTGRPLIMWQVPVGNQYFLTMNNTPGHWQDNRAEYFIGHSDQLLAAGILAVLFGPGNGRDVRQTTFEDAEADGVTNNGGVPTTDSDGACRACNTHVSEFADDDGGFLRVFVGAYYAVPPAGPGSLNPVQPYRLVDTRQTTRLGPGGSINVQVSGRNGLPDSGVVAAAVNVTVTSPTRPSYVALYPAGAAWPGVSSLNFGPGQTIANLSQVALGQRGQLSVYNSEGSVDVILDLVGWYGADDGSGHRGLYRSLAPTRVLDTRAGTGGYSRPFAPDTERDLDLGSALPDRRASAVVLNLTAVNGSHDSYLTAYPAGTGGRPEASNLNFPAGRNLPNRVIVKLGSSGQAGRISLYNSEGYVDVVADLVGWFTDGADTAATGGLFHAQAPQRILDTRPQSRVGPYSSPLGPDSTLRVGIGGQAGVPATASAAVLNVAVTQPSSASFLTVYPDGQAMPATSDLNFGPLETIANLDVVQLGSSGAANAYNNLGSTDVLADVEGWYG